MKYEFSDLLLTHSVHNSTCVLKVILDAEFVNNSAFLFFVICAHEGMASFSDFQFRVA